MKKIIFSDEMITKLEIPKPLPPIYSQPQIPEEIKQKIITITDPTYSTQPNFSNEEAETSPQIPKKIKVKLNEIKD